MNQQTKLRESQDTETPPDGYGAGFLEYSIRTSFRDLCRLVGRGQAREIIAEIIAAELERRQ